MNVPEGWSHAGSAIERTFTFKDFSAAFEFMSRVAVVCEELDHHPDWSNSWNVVRVSLTTHSAGSVVTDKDLELAARMNGLVTELS